MREFEEGMIRWFIRWLCLVSCGGNAPWSFKARRTSAEGLWREKTADSGPIGSLISSIKQYRELPGPQVERTNL
jgi:hypothetical protein